MPEYTYKFSVVADVNLPIPGLTETIEEMIGQRLTMQGKQLEIAKPKLTFGVRLGLDELEQLMDIVREGFEKQDEYSNVRVYFSGKEVIKDA